jgi:hypothetical protein
MSPRANVFLLQDKQDMIYIWGVENEHPEVSSIDRNKTFSALLTINIGNRII